MSKSHSTLTHARLREVLLFDTATGEFYWREKLATHTVVGSRAGGVDNRGYWRIRLFGISYAAHRLAWFYVHGEWPKADIDHKNRARVDNRLRNLRDVSRSVNMQNVTAAGGASGLRGVRRHRNGRFEARIVAGGKRHTLGYYSTADAAYAAYMEAKLRLHAGYIPGSTG